MYKDNRAIIITAEIATTIRSSMRLIPASEGLRLLGSNLLKIDPIFIRYLLLIPLLAKYVTTSCLIGLPLAIVLVL